MLPAAQLATGSVSITLRTTSGMVLFSSVERAASTMKSLTHKTGPVKPIINRCNTQTLIDAVDQQVSSTGGGSMCIVYRSILLCIEFTKCWVISGKYMSVREK